MQAVQSQAEFSADLAADLAVVLGFGLAALALGAVTLRRRTP
jgi:hypothetical protein